MVFLLSVFSRLRSEDSVNSVHRAHTISDVTIHQQLGSSPRRRVRGDGGTGDVGLGSSVALDLTSPSAGCILETGAGRVVVVVIDVMAYMMGVVPDFLGRLSRILSFTLVSSKTSVCFHSEQDERR